MSAIGAVTQQGIISTQIERVQNDGPAPPPQPQAQVSDRVEAPPPPPPPPTDSGRGATVDTTV